MQVMSYLTLQVAGDPGVTSALLTVSVCVSYKLCE